MSTTTELLRANLREVFGNRYAAARRAAIERVYAPEVVFTDPDGPVVGWDALEQRAAGLIDTAPESFVFAEDGLAYADASTGVQGWTFGPAGAPVARGVDVITVRDGRVVDLRTILAD